MATKNGHKNIRVCNLFNFEAMSSRFCIVVQIDIPKTFENKMAAQKNKMAARTQK